MPKKRKVMPNGRNPNGQYVKFSYALFQPAAWRSLNPAAVKVFIELRTRYNGFNDDKITLSYEDAARTLHMRKSTVGRALMELEEKGFILRTRQGVRAERIASEYSVTTAGPKAKVGDSWRRWKPKSQTVPPQYQKTQIPSHESTSINSPVPP